MQDPNFPQDFKEIICQLLATKSEQNQFWKTLNQTAKRAIRFNKFKPIPSYLGLKKAVPWAEDAYYYDENINFDKDPAWIAGGLYVQEPATLILQKVIPTLPKNAVVLDLCASPGGKSTILENILQPTQTLISNEVVSKRNRILIENMRKWGMTKTLISQNQPAEFGKLSESFDLVLVDAPCSGEGLYRKDRHLFNKWSLEMVKKSHFRQLEILHDVSDCVKNGGYLIYATCTYNEIENEQTVDSFLDIHPDFETVKLNFEPIWKIQVNENNGYRFWPHLTDSEGFFFTILRRKISNSELPERGYELKDLKSNKDLLKVYNKENFKNIDKKMQSELVKFVNPDILDDVYLQDGSVFYLSKILLTRYLELISKGFRIHKKGVYLGKFTRSGFIPSSEIFFSGVLNADILVHNILDFEFEKLIQNQALDLPQELSGNKNWIVISYKGQILSWAKVLADRINIYFDK